MKLWKVIRKLLGIATDLEQAGVPLPGGEKTKVVLGTGRKLGWWEKAPSASDVFSSELSKPASFGEKPNVK